MPTISQYGKINEFALDMRRHDNELNIEIIHHKLVNAITFAKESMLRLKRYVTLICHRS